MNKEEIIRLARNAGLIRILDEHAHEYGNGRFEYTDYPELETFAALVAAHKTEVAVAEAYRCGQEHGAVNGGPFNFCPRCGKRAYPDTIHTCTPPAFMG